MPAFEVEERGSTDSLRSRLGSSLIRIHSGLAQTRQKEEHVEDLFQKWQEKWASRRAQIARRLELIETQLDTLSRQRDRSPP